MKFYKRLIAFWGQCIRDLGGLLRHPKTVSLVMSVIGGFLLWIMKVTLIVLLSKIGIAVPMF